MSGNGQSPMSPRHPYAGDPDHPSRGNLNANDERVITPIRYGGATSTNLLPPAQFVENPIGSGHSTRVPSLSAEESSSTPVDPDRAPGQDNRWVRGTGFQEQGRKERFSNLRKSWSLPLSTRRSPPPELVVDEETPPKTPRNLLGLFPGVKTTDHATQVNTAKTSPASSVSSLSHNRPSRLNTQMGSDNVVNREPEFQNFRAPIPRDLTTIGDIGHLFGEGKYQTTDRRFPGQEIHNGAPAVPSNNPRRVSQNLEGFEFSSQDEINLQKSIEDDISYQHGRGYQHPNSKGPQGPAFLPSSRRPDWNVPQPRGVYEGDSNLGHPGAVVVVSENLRAHKHWQRLLADLPTTPKHGLIRIAVSLLERLVEDEKVQSDLRQKIQHLEESVEKERKLRDEALSTSKYGQEFLPSNDELEEVHRTNFTFTRPDSLLGNSNLPLMQSTSKHANNSYYEGSFMDNSSFGNNNKPHFFLQSY